MGVAPTLLALVVQKKDSVIGRINCYPVSKYQESQQLYLMDNDLSRG